jgi:3D (Asp-Asp-Asp) domain-containing protein
MKLILAPIAALVLAMGFHSSPTPPRSASAPDAEVRTRRVCRLEWSEVDAMLGLDRQVVFPVTVTGYSSTRDQCDEDPFITASNKRVRHGIIALSRDLLRRYNPEAPFHWGDRVYLEGVGEFVVEDSMNARFRSRADIWFPDRASAREWGVQELKLIAMPPDDFLP